MKLTKEFLDNHPDFEHDTKIEEWHKEADPNFPDYAYYVSKDGRITIDNITNLSATAWNIHVDNEDFESLAGFSVETVEDANTILAIYKLKI